MSTYVQKSTRDGESRKVVSLVSEPEENNNGNGNERRLSLVSTGTYSGFATSETAEEIDDSLFANPDDEETV